MGEQHSQSDNNFLKNNSRWIAIIILFVLLSTALLPCTMSATENNNQSHFTPDEEGDHFPCGCEWWCFHSSVTLQSGTHLDILTEFQYSTKAVNRSDINVVLFLFYCFNRDTGQVFDFTQSFVNKGNQSGPFSFKKNRLDISFGNCTIKGLYPSYSVYVENEDKSFIMNISLNATSSSHWVAQNISNGYFPWGLGWARYGFIPRLDVVGNITFNGTTSRSCGNAYYEHLWGNFSYLITLKSPSEFRAFVKNLPKIIPFMKWIWTEQSRTSSQLKLSTSNHYGYDWIWGTFTNGWSVHLGFFHTMGGEVSLTPDGQTFWDLANLSVKYTRLLYIPETDTYYPLDMDITARGGDKTLHLSLTTTTEPYLGVLVIYPASRLCCGAGGIQTAGIVEGYYTDSNQNISLQGNCTIGPFRQYPTTRFVSLDVARIRSPHATGFSIEIVSHLLGARLYIERLRRPHHQLNISLEMSRPTSPVKPPEQPYDGVTLYVGGSGPGNLTNIQDAVNLAHDGDTVFVHGGNYHENVVVDKAIRLVGENKGDTFLTGGTRAAIKIIANNVEVTGFTIDAGQANSHDDAAIYVTSSGNHIHDNLLIKSEWYGIIIFNSSYNVIENNSLIGNDIGIWLCQARDNTVRDNNISQSDYVGIWLWPFAIHNTISYNNFVDNKINARNNDATARNIWSHNYWDDYIGLRWRYVVDSNNDGIGIIPYRISSFNRDLKPLLTPIS